MKKQDAINLVMNNENFSSARLAAKDGEYFIIKREGDKHVQVFSSETESKKITLNKLYNNYRFMDNVMGDGSYVIK